MYGIFFVLNLELSVKIPKRNIYIRNCLYHTKCNHANLLF